MCIRSIMTIFFLASTLCSCSAMFRGMKDLEKYENEGWYIHPAKVRGQPTERRQKGPIRSRWDSSVTVLDNPEDTIKE